MGSRVAHSRLAISVTAAIGAASVAVGGYAEAAPARQSGRIGYIDSVNGGWITANPDGSDRRAVTLSGPGLPADAQALSLKYSKGEVGHFATNTSRPSEAAVAWLSSQPAGNALAAEKRGPLLLTATRGPARRA